MCSRGISRWLRSDQSLSAPQTVNTADDPSMLISTIFGEPRPGHASGYGFPPDGRAEIALCTPKLQRHHRPIQGLHAHASHACKRSVPTRVIVRRPCPGCGQAATSTQGDREMRTHPGWIQTALLMALAIVGHARAPAASEKHPGHMHQAVAAAPRSPLFNNLGTYHRAITTQSPQAQRYFDQGMRLMWGFNLEEAQRSFEEASRLDSTCAMCAWGVAFSLGPHINLPGIPERTRPAFHAAEKAVSLESGASDVERALIDAMAKRYCDPPPADPKGQYALDSTYAAAMKEVAARFPDDNDVLAL